MKVILILIKNLFSIKFIIFLLIILLITFIIKSIIVQNDLFYNYDYKYNYILSNLIYFLKLNNIINNKFIKFIYYIIILIFIYIIFVNFIKKKKLKFFLIHFNILLIIINFYNFDYNCSLYNNSQFYIWLPNNWSSNTSFIKYFTKFYFYKFPLILKLKSSNNFYKRNFLIKFIWNKIKIKNRDNNIFINFPGIYSNILYYQSSYDNFNSYINFIIYYIYNNRINKFFIKSVLDDYIFLNIFSNKFLIKIDKLNWSKFFNKYFIKFCIYDLANKSETKFNLLLNFIKNLDYKLFIQFNNKLNNITFQNKVINKLYSNFYFNKILYNNLYKIILLNKINLYKNFNKNIYICAYTYIFKNLFSHNINFLINFYFIFYNFINYFEMNLILIKLFNYLNNLFLFNKYFINDYKLIYFNKFIALNNKNYSNNKFFILIKKILIKNSLIIYFKKRENNLLMFYLIIIFFISIIFNFINNNKC